MSRSGTCAARSTSSLRTRTSPSPSAPIASSGCDGTPSLRTKMTSSGASRARATSYATGTPPRGSATTTGCSSRRWSSRAASRRPASARSRNGTLRRYPHQLHARRSTFRSAGERRLIQVIRAWCYSEDAEGSTSVDPADLEHVSAKPETLLWIDVDAPTEADISFLSDALGIHHIMAEDLLKAGQR